MYEDNAHSAACFVSDDHQAYRDSCRTLVLAGLLTTAVIQPPDGPPKVQDCAAFAGGTRGRVEKYKM